MNRKWWRLHFEDHPELRQKTAASYANPHAKDKRTKAICKLCLEAKILSEQQKDFDDQREGRRNGVRTTSEIVASLWAFSGDSKDPACPWIQARTENFMRHLKKCERQSHETRARAEVICIERGWLRDPDAEPEPALPPNPGTYSLNSPLPTVYHPLHPLSIQVPPSLATPGSSTSQLTSPLLLSQPAVAATSTSAPPFSGLYPISHAPSPAASPSFLLPDLGTPSSFGSRSSSPLVLSQSVNAVDSGSRPPSSKRMRVLSSSKSQYNEMPTWTSSHQERLSSHIARITASCGFPYSWIENPAVRAFFGDLLPGATPISSYQLTHRFVPQEVEKFRAAAKESCRGEEATLQTDGWTGINFHHLLAFMMTTARREVHTIRVQDVSSERNTAENLVTLLKNVMEDVQKNWGVNVVAITSDASGESRAARKRLVKQFPWLVAPDCYAHQINLIVGDYFKAPVVTIYKDYTKKATELITWLRSKTIVLSLLRDIQVALNQSAQRHRVLSVIRAVLTRWTAHFLAFRRLLDLKWALDILVKQENDRGPGEKKIITGDAAARGKAREMFALIDSPLFWQITTRTVKHIEPLSLAVNFAQAAHCRLDEVLIIFAYLCLRYQQLHNEGSSQDHDLIAVIIASLETRWSKCDQDIFIAAVILNPLYKIEPFAQLSRFTNAGVYALLVKLWRRFYQSDPPPDLYTELRDYLHNTGSYRDFPGYVAAVTRAAEDRHERPDPMEMYRGMQFSNREPSPLQKLARRLFSICANSASCERLFSVFGTILTRLRSRLGLNSMVNLAELRLHLRDEYMRMGDNKSRLRRKRNIISTLNQSTAPDSQPTNSASSPSEATDAESEHLDSTSENSLESILQALGERADQDLDVEDLDEGPLEDFTPSLEKISLQQLFNFVDDHWSRTVHRLGMKSLDDELEFYELVDMDAEGEDDLDNVIDDMMAAAM